MLLKNQTFLLAASALILAATAARADVTISSDATQNMSCVSGVCQPTASNAVLNVSDLENLIGSGSDVTVATTGAGVQANNIDVTAKLGWSANTLTLNAYQSLFVTAPVTVKGKSGLSILTNDGGNGGELAFSGKGHVTFKSLSGRLSINGTSYGLENSIASLAAAIAKKPSGSYALSADYDASKDGTYSSAPIGVFTGSFEGLGNVISNLTIVVPLSRSNEATGLFSISGGSISDLGITAANIQIERFKPIRGESLASAGLLAGSEAGAISRCYAEGTLSVPKETAAGGLVGEGGAISESHAQIDLKVTGGDAFAGGLVGFDGLSTITRSFASGTIRASQFGDGAKEMLGGLIGFLDMSTIENSYATSEVKGGQNTGGLVGGNLGDIDAAYSTGQMTGPVWVGGLIGGDSAPSGRLNDTYWDTTMSGITDPGQGAGTPANDPGITGLSTEQLQSGLPPGFDPTVWGENANINNGLPYLLANPPTGK